MRRQRERPVELTTAVQHQTFSSSWFVRVARHNVGTEAAPPFDWRSVESFSTTAAAAALLMYLGRECVWPDVTCVSFSGDVRSGVGPLSLLSGFWLLQAHGPGSNAEEKERSASSLIRYQISYHIKAYKKIRKKKAASFDSRRSVVITSRVYSHSSSSQSSTGKTAASQRTLPQIHATPTAVRTTSTTA